MCGDCDIVRSGYIVIHYVVSVVGVKLLIDLLVILSPSEGNTLIGVDKFLAKLVGVHSMCVSLYPFPIWLLGRQILWEGGYTAIIAITAIRCAIYTATVGG
jgi:hypothetical protein